MITIEEWAHHAWAIIAANNGFFHQAYFERQIAEAIRAAVKAEHTRITEMAERIEQGTYTTSRSVSQVLRAERVTRSTETSTPNAPSAGE